VDIECPPPVEASDIVVMADAVHKSSTMAPRVDIECPPEGASDIVVTTDAMLEDAQPSEGAAVAASAATTSWASWTASRNSLSMVKHRIYPVPHITDYVHPLCLLVVVAMTLSYCSQNFVPDISVAGARLMCIGAYFGIQGAAIAVFLLTGGGPKRAWLPFLVITVVLMSVSDQLVGISLLGVISGFFLLVVGTYKWTSCPSAMIGYIVWIIVLQLCLMAVLQFMRPIQDRCPNDFVKGTVLPITSWMYSCVGLVLLKLHVRSCLPVGSFTRGASFPSAS
jgi:hypothetical protein